YYEGQDVYIICAIPTQEITGNVLAVTAVPLFVAFIFLSLQLLYALMLMGEHNPDPHGADPLSFRFLLFKRMAVLLVLSILFTIGSSLYTQALYATYLRAHSNMEESSALRSSLSRNEENQKKTSEEYYSYLENLTSLAAAFVSNNKKQITKKDLSEMAFKLGAEHILLYNNKGEVILSDAYYKGLELSSSPRELSNEFRKLLTGTPVLSQQTVDEDYLDKPYRYVGAIVTNSEDEPNGFIQLAFSPDYLKSSLSETTVGSLPSTFSGRNNAFAFIVDGKDHTVIYYPDESVIDQNVEDYGLKEDMLQDDYFICTWFDDQERLLYSSFWNDDILYTAASVNVITMESMSRGIYISVAGIIIQLLFFLILFIIAGDNRSYAMEISGDEWAIEAQNKLVERLAAGRILRLLNISFFIFSGAVCFILLLRDLIFRNNYVILDLLNGHWNRGLHLFAFTACWITVCIVFFVMSLVLFILKLTGKLMNSRGETIISMLISFARYIAVIGTVFYCAKLLGAPTDTLLASAGILTVVVGLGAQSLVTDVLAGLFIIFEKAFKVGDIIKVEPEEWRGRVLEIGIRNTRVMDIDANNVKIIHNSSLNQIVNLSDLPTYCYTTIGIEYSEGLSRVEEIIKAELPDIRKRIPEATEGPLYCGVSELGDSAVILKFRTSCRNEDYLRVRYAVNRELKLLFDRHSINIPFPQVVINPREEKEHIYREL
ncbi:MAG: mechanosensitive ion channel, partial [Lachnospiraceae bacterium]|nr:mechanosensitive ion channel [Lachnospiraceae bacterium]